MSITTASEARELTPEERKERENHCFNLEQAIKESIATGRAALWALSEQLYLFNEENGWTALGYETQQEWLAQPEIGMSRNTFFRMVRRYKQLVVTNEVEPKKLLELEPSKVDIVLPSVEDEDVPLNDALEDVKSLGARDLREKYIGDRVKKDSKDSQNGEVIDGKAKSIKTDQEPQTASQNGGEPPKEDKEVQQLKHSAGVVDSWFHMGGDRRKAQRHLSKFRELHPLFQALVEVENCLLGAKDGPTREEAQTAWLTICRELNVEVEVEK